LTTRRSAAFTAIRAIHSRQESQKIAVRAISQFGEETTKISRRKTYLCVAQRDFLSSQGCEAAFGKFRIVNNILNAFAHIQIAQVGKEDRAESEQGLYPDDRIIKAQLIEYYSKLPRPFWRM
jgi:hypothetical protein